MSTVVAAPTPLPTWRDAVTPTSRASRRRWALGYALLLTAGGLHVATADDAGGATLLTLVALVVVFGMLRRGTRRLTALDHPALDERDRAVRDRAFRLAYPLLLLVVAALFAYLLVGLPDARRPFVVDGVRGTDLSSFLDPEVVLGLGAWMAVWAVFLPTAALAWVEPDDGLDEEAGAALPETTRDAILAAALVLGLLLGALADDDLLGLAPFVLGIVALGALARRRVVRA